MEQKLSPEELDQLCAQYLGESPYPTKEPEPKVAPPKKKSAMPEPKRVPEIEIVEEEKPAPKREPLPANPKDRMRKVSREKTAQLLTSLGVDLGVKFDRRDMNDMLAFLLSADEQQLTALKKNSRTPLAIKTVIKAIENDSKSGDLSTVKYLWNRIFGKEGLDGESAMTTTALATTSIASSQGGLPTISRQSLIYLQKNIAGVISNPNEIKE